MSDFQATTIELRYGTDNWGPYEFDFTDLVPEGLSIDSVDVKAYVGIVKPSADLSDETEITSDIIDDDVVPSVSNNVVSVYFCYSETYKGEKATLIFYVTSTTGAVYPFYFNSVVIK